MLKTGLPLLKSVIKPLGLLGLTAASSAIDAGVQKKVYGSGTTTLVISNKEMNDIMKIVQDFDSFGVEHVLREIKKFIGHKNIKTNIFRIQADNSIM